MMLIFKKYSVFNSLKTDKQLQQLCFHVFSESYFWSLYFLSIFALMWNIHTYTTVYYINNFTSAAILQKKSIFAGWYKGAVVTGHWHMHDHAWIDGWNIGPNMLSYWEAGNATNIYSVIGTWIKWIHKYGLHAVNNWIKRLFQFVKFFDSNMT